LSGRRDDPAMEDARLGRRFRALRHRLGWRQRDVGDRAGISQDVVSLTELGRIEDVSVRALRRHARALGAELRLELWFRAGELDRLMDEGHAALVGAIAVRLESLGWEVRPEVSFAVYAERGSIDLVAWHAASRTLLVIEVKTELTSIEETLRRHDAKARLAAAVVAERFGWKPVRVARLLVLPDGTTPRRQVARHADVLRAAYPLRGRVLRAWLREPSGSIAGLAFLPPTNQDRATRPVTSRRRISRPRRPSQEADGLSRAGIELPPSTAYESGSSSVGRRRSSSADHEGGS
jgi:transcriptional regulator with XRE-family HTH domain